MPFSIQVVYSLARTVQGRVLSTDGTAGTECTNKRFLLGIIKHITNAYNVLLEATMPVLLTGRSS